MLVLNIKDILVLDKGSEALKEQFNDYCHWCWGYVYGDCDVCRRIYRKYYIPIRKKELQEKLGLNNKRMEDVDMDKFEELKKAAMPLLEFLNKYYNPHTYAIVTEGNVEIVCGEMSIPLPVRD